MAAPSNASASSSGETWFVATDDNGTFELSLSDLTEAIETGRVPFSALVWRAGMRGWLSLNEVPLLQLLIARLDFSRLSSTQSSTGAPGTTESSESSLAQSSPPALPQPREFEDDDLTVVAPAHGALLDLDDDELTAITEFHGELGHDAYVDHPAAPQHTPTAATHSDMRPVLVRPIIALEAPKHQAPAMSSVNDESATAPFAAPVASRESAREVDAPHSPSLSDRAPPKPQSVPAIPVAKALAEAQPSLPARSASSEEKLKAPSPASLLALAGKSEAPKESGAARAPSFSPPRQAAPALRSAKAPLPSQLPSTVSQRPTAPTTASAAPPAAAPVVRSRPPLPVRSARPPAEAKPVSVPAIRSAEPASVSPQPVAAVQAPTVVAPVSQPSPSKAIVPSAPPLVAPPAPQVVATPSGPPPLPAPVASPAPSLQNSPQAAASSAVASPASRLPSAPQAVVSSAPVVVPELRTPIATAVMSQPATPAAFAEDEKSGYGPSLAPSVSSITSALRPSRRPLYVAGGAFAAIAAIVLIFVGSKPTRPSRSVASTTTELQPTRKPSNVLTVSQPAAAAPEVKATVPQVDAERAPAATASPGGEQPSIATAPKSASSETAATRTASKLSTPSPARADASQPQAPVAKRQPVAKLTDTEPPAAKRARSDSDAPATKPAKKPDAAASVASWDQGTVEHRSWMSPGF